MSEKFETNGNTPGPSRSTSPGSEPTAPVQRPPTREERLKMIAAYQVEGLGRSDPHVANLQVLDGDVMVLAHLVWERLQRHTNEDTIPGENRRFIHDAQLYLQTVRQIERDARILWQLTRAAHGDSGSA